MTGLSIEALKAGDVLLTSERGIVPAGVFIKLANFFSRGMACKDWTHAALYIGNGKVVEAVTDKGVRVADLASTYPAERFEILVLRQPRVDAESLARAVRFSREQVDAGYKYNWWGLAYFLFYNFIPAQVHFILDNEIIDAMFGITDAYFCSELVSDAFKHAGIYCFEREPFKIMPMDFANELLFKRVGMLGVSAPKPWGLYIPYFMAVVVAMIISIILLVLLPAAFVVLWLLRRVWCRGKK
jgi:hypothetical protein